MILGWKWTRKYELKAALANCKQDEDSMNTYYLRLKKIWDELDNSAEILTLISKEREEEKLFQFLIGLNDGIHATMNQTLFNKNQCQRLKLYLPQSVKKNNTEA